MNWSDHPCQLVEIYDFLGKRWTILILHNIGTIPITFNELEKLLKRKISSILLSQRLKELMRLGIIKKENINGRVSYVITERGEALKRLMHKIKEWAIEADYDIPEKCKKHRCTCSNLHEEES